MVNLFQFSSWRAYYYDKQPILDKPTYSFCNIKEAPQIVNKLTSVSLAIVGYSSNYILYMQVCEWFSMTFIIIT